MPFNLVSGAGAGGAVQGLQDVLKQRFLERQQAELEAARVAENEQRQAQMAQTASQFERRLGQEGSQFQQRFSLDQLQHAEQVKQFAQTHNLSLQEAARRLAADTEQKRQFEVETKTGVEESAKDRATRLEAARIGVQGRNEKMVKVPIVNADGTESFQYMTESQAAQLGPMAAPAGKGGAALRAKTADLTEARRLAGNILEKGAAMGWASTGPVAGWKTYFKSLAGMTNPNEEQLRTDIGNLYSLVAHERFGGALTGGEKALADTFLATETDNDVKLQQKLLGLIRLADSKIGTLTGAVPKGAPSRAAAMQAEGDATAAEPAAAQPAAAGSGNPLYDTYLASRGKKR